MAITEKHLLRLILGFLVLQWLCIILPTLLETRVPTEIVGNQNLIVLVDKENIIKERKVDDKDTIIAIVDEYLQHHEKRNVRKAEVLNRLGITDCIGCKKFDFNTLLNTGRCLYMPSNKLQILILIMSKPTNVLQRKTIRNTYLTDLQKKPLNYVFVLGKTDDPRMEENIKKESDFYNDIVKFDFFDSYENLTIKSVMAFKWAVWNCEHARFVLKVDDDVWINTGALLRASESSPFISYIGGFRYNDAEPVRKTHHKHFVSEQEYQSEKFPPYCNGPSYIMTIQTAEDISIVADYLPFLHMEDVFIGLCIQTLNYTVTHNPKFHKFEGYRHACYYKSDDVFTYHQIPPLFFNIIQRIKCNERQNFTRISPVDRSQQYQLINKNLTDFSKRPKCDKCFNFQHSVLISNNVCDLGVFHLFVLVFSSATNLNRRLTIRNTYLKPFRRQNPHLRFLFIMGNSNEARVNTMVKEENKQFHDILKFNFTDTYLNLTLKTLNGFNWISRKCRNARYVLKIDDDVWLNAPGLLKSLQTNVPFQHIGGECHFKGQPIRNPASKYYLSPENYPYYNFPAFCAGPSYILRRNVINDIMQISRDVPFFQLEDVYIGMCLYYLGYKVTFLPTFNTYTKFQFHCWFKSDKIQTFHSVSSNFMTQIWRTDCSKYSHELWKQGFHGKNFDTFQKFRPFDSEFRKDINREKINSIESVRKYIQHELVPKIRNDYHQKTNST
ncbi:B3GALT1 [Mytilus coruscus]|uniref:B3GALT1 n=1 Tax=Mytilus coruscus TaxID=42192 RepID=A0A6J8DM82_MYTCO|nr:B3GALT1 [Mytilus coruscus]